MAKELKISQSSMQRLLINELNLKPYKFQKAHDLTPAQKKVRLERAKKLLRLVERGEFPNIVFSGRAVCKFPKRSCLLDRTYENLSQRLATRKQKPP